MTETAGTRGFLFCDLRGYTAFIERHGDAAAAELLAAYRELVRSVIAAHEGAEIKTEGDSVYVVFPAASSALEAGLGIVAGAAVRSTRERPIRVGVGIHAGETVATTEGPVGGAVNIAARVCAKAQAGEVLVTDTVRALTRTYLPYAYTSLGAQSLKGIAGGIPLYRVEAVPSSRLARLRRRLGARRRRVVLVGGLVVVLLVGGLGLYAANRPPDCLGLPATTKDVVARIDPARKCVVAVYPVGQRPSSIVAADGLIWVANEDSTTISFVDPATGATGAAGVGSPPIALAAGPGAVYAVTFDGLVARIPTKIKHVIDEYTLPKPDRPRALGLGYVSAAFASDRVWITNALRGDVFRLRLPEGGAPINVVTPAGVNQGTGGQEDTTGLGPIAAAGGIVWMADASEPRVYRVDGVSSHPDSIGTDPAHAGASAVAATPEAVWLLHDDGYLTRIDIGTGAMSSTKVDATGASVYADSGAVWIADRSHARVISVDRTTGEITEAIDLGAGPGGIVVADGAVWVTIPGP